MGSIKKLCSPECNVHLLLTSSSLAEMYVYDILKAQCKGNVDSVVTVDTRTDFNGMLDLVNMQPLLAEKWLFVLGYKGAVKSLLKKYVGIFQADTSVFLIKVDNYKDYKECKEALGRSVNDIYLNTISSSDVMYLLNGYKISQKSLDFVSKSYFRDPEKVFVLRREMDNGAEVTNDRDVIRICGESASSVVRFAFLLLNEMPTSEAGLKRVYSKRVKMLVDLCDTFTARSAYNFLVATLRDILNIKVLYLQGVIYDSIRDLPEAYDEKRLSKYNMYLGRITKELEYEKILWLYMELCSNGRWVTAQDGVLFLYKYYLDSVKIGG